MSVIIVTLLNVTEVDLNESMQESTEVINEIIIDKWKTKFSYQPE